MKKAIELLQQHLDSLPYDHHEIPGLIRAIEILRVYRPREEQK